MLKNLFLILILAIAIAGCDTYNPLCVTGNCVLPVSHTPTTTQTPINFVPDEIIKVRVSKFGNNDPRHDNSRKTDIDIDGTTYSGYRNIQLHFYEPAETRTWIEITSFINEPASLAVNDKIKVGVKYIGHTPGWANTEFTSAIYYYIGHVE